MKIVLVLGLVALLSAGANAGETKPPMLYTCNHVSAVVFINSVQFEIML